MKYVAVRKLKCIPLNKAFELKPEAYDFVNKAQYAQYLAFNKAMSFYMTCYYNHDGDIKSPAFKEDLKKIRFNQSNPLFSSIEFGKGVDTLSCVSQRVRKDFSSAIKNGLAKGERSITNYKRNYPLLTNGRDLKPFQGEDGNFYFGWVNHTVLKVVSGRKDKDYLELQETLRKIVTKEYKCCQSRVSVAGSFLLLELTLEMPVQKQEKVIKGRRLGVDLGVNVPAYICLSDSPYIRKALGSREDFLKVRQQMKQRRSREYKKLNLAAGGKGRKDKLSAINRFKQKEHNWVKTYNHQLSRQIVNFAHRYHVEQINMEKLSKTGFGNELLGSWSYYQLQLMIEYKAARLGIPVAYVNPKYTSQMCSKCGYIDDQNRLTQENFVCQSCGHKMNADHNAALNIGRSNDYRDNSEVDKE